MMSAPPRRRGRLSLLGVAAGLLLAASPGATAASAESFAELCKNHGCPHWSVSSHSEPTGLPPGGEGRIVATAVNLGDANVTGSAAHPLKLTFVLPAQLEELEVRTSLGNNKMCSKTSPFVCSFANSTIAPYGSLEVTVRVRVSEPSGTVASVGDEVRIEGGEMTSGGEAQGASVNGQLSVTGEPTPFGVEDYELAPENADGTRDTQAGSHPFQLTSSLVLNQTTELGKFVTQESSGAPEEVLGALPAEPAPVRDLRFALPPGLAANAGAVPQCSALDFSQITGPTNNCPANTAVGVATTSIIIPPSPTVSNTTVPVFNLSPAPGEPARFGFETLEVPTILDTAVRSGGDYSAIVDARNVTTVALLLHSDVTLWGAPGEAVHDKSRGWRCVNGGEWNNHQPCEEPFEASSPPQAFLELPTSCAGPLKTSVAADSWRQPGTFMERSFTFEDGVGNPLERLEGCEELPFSPTMEVQPDQQSANTPTALAVHEQLPQQGTLEPQGLGESAVKDTTVTLPEGVLLNPSAANGLEACAEGETQPPGGVGFTGLTEFEPQTPVATFTETLPEPLEPGKNFCPNASKVGTVHIKSPLLAHELEGGVYLAEQNANPFGSLVALYIVAEDPVSRVLVKLAGEVSLNATTGQVTTTFKNTPQLPYEDLRLELFGGLRASLTSPPVCGPYATSSSLAPWSGNAPVNPPSSFSITSGPGGAQCSNPQSFAPGFNAQTTNVQADAFTSFTVNIAHPDSDQALTSLSMHLPPGLAGMLSHVKLCQEPQAEQGACGPESLIGHTTVSAGLGETPFTQTGQVFITGPYKGAPFGLSIVVPTKAGPFDFGNIVTRATISVDPNNAALTIASELPTMINTASHKTGIPAQLKQVNVTVEGPASGFQFNPTSCNPMKIDATLTGSHGASASVSAPFQVANCASLPFKPKFTASTQAKTSKASGASLKVKVTSAFGQANIGKTTLTLPKALPSRLTTIQKACTAAVFDANPATCPEGSNIGSATVHTPVLSSALTGPAYLVSHGSAAFPDVEFVLQGEGITLILDGRTDIKKGITYSRFESLPDAPVSTFETTLPEGPHSALAANLPESAKGNLCSTKLVMPTTITGQNGAVIKQNTRIAVSGCGGVKGFKATRSQLLGRALKLCRKKKSTGNRVACERQARKKYGAKSSRKKK